MKQFAACCAFAALIAVLSTTAVAQTLELQSGTVVRFLNAEEARALLGATDPWVDGFSPFDRQLRMGSPEPVSKAQFLEFSAANALAWDDHGRELMTEVVAKTKSRLEALNLVLPLPDEVLLIHTTGKEEGGANYTRSSAIVASELDSTTFDQAYSVFLHELFHVMTRHDPSVRDPLYRIIGFEPRPPLEYPEALMPRKISNPDGFHFEHVIEIQAEEQSHKAMMLTLSKTKEYTGGKLFDYVTIAMLPVTSGDGVTRAVIRDGEPVLYQMGQFTGYFEQIGQNTQYIIHPEEIMADNFKFAVMGTEDLPNPEIIDAVLEVLTAVSADSQ